MDHDNKNAKLVTTYTACSAATSSLCFVFLLYSGYLYTAGHAVSYLVICTAIVTELIKLCVGYAQGVPLSRLFWHEDRLSVVPQKSPHILRDLARCFLVLTGMCLIYYIVAVLFGAEIFSKHEQTLLLSLSLTTLTILPSCIHLGPMYTVNMICGTKPNDLIAISVYRNLLIILTGAWLGAFVIPLDWDRPWQEWPVPCVFGALVGSFLGNTAQILFDVFINKISKTKVKR